MRWIKLKDTVEFYNTSRPWIKEGNDKKRDTYGRSHAPCEGWELTLNVFKSGICPIKLTQGKRLKILALKQMRQRLPIARTQVKAGNTSQNLINEIREITYSLYRAKDIAKTVYNNIKNSISV